MGHSDEVKSKLWPWNFKAKFTLLGYNVVSSYIPTLCGESAPILTAHRRNYCLSVKCLYNPFTLGEHQHSIHYAPVTHLPIRYKGVQHLPVLAVQEFFNFCNVNDPFYGKKKSILKVSVSLGYVLLLFQSKMTLIWAWPIISDIIVVVFLTNKNKRAQNSKRF